MNVIRDRNISVMGLGYVGLPVAVAFAKKQKVIAYDINVQRIEFLKKQLDINHEISAEDLAMENLQFTFDPADLRCADFHIVAVPSPINQAKQPDFSPLIHASRSLGEYLKKGDIVVYESTVYPGATEEQCIPILEKTSGLKYNQDFFVGYSPERINPGDPARNFEKIQKVVSADAPHILEIIAHQYSRVVKAGIYKAPSIKIAEAAKVIENIQRDLNVALVNELSIIFHQLDIDTSEVLKAASTKWNFLPFVPGLVGGHCIGVDPYYLTYKATMSGIHPEIILAGRRINDHMGHHIASRMIKKMSQLGKISKQAKIGILGLTFKENCGDIRNTKVIDIIRELQEYEMNVLVHDPFANSEFAETEYQLKLVSWDALVDLDALILAVPHQTYIDYPLNALINKLKAPKLIFDVKSVLDKEILNKNEVVVCRL